MPLLNLIFIWLAQKLYPMGRAFRMPEPKMTGEYITDEQGNYIQDEQGNFLVTENYSATGGILYRLHRALSISFALLWQGVTGVSYAQLPDNPYFTIADCHDWYRRLGIYDSGLVSMAEMMAAIRQRMSFPITPLNKQNYLFIQGQLQAAGFNVNVYENRFASGRTFITKTPAEIYTGAYPLAEYGSFEYGDTEYGTGEGADGITVCANYLEPAADATLVVTNYRSTFFIADPSGITNFASIPVGRETEFRQLLIKLKPIHTVGYLAVNFI